VEFALTRLRRLILEPDSSTVFGMLTWQRFAEARPDLADAGRALFYQWNVGLAFLATVRKDGGPRCHPMCPVITDDGLYALIEPDGPKRYDLERDGRYAMHCFPPANNEDAFYVTGTARRVDDQERRDPVVATFWKERGQDEPPPQAAKQILFEFLIETSLLTRTTGHGDWSPQHTIWKA
jgi:hypothetical protein